MLRPSPNPFTVPACRVPRHRWALGAAAVGVLFAGAALLLPLTDEALARALPFGLGLVIAPLGGLLARLGRDDA